MSGTRARRALRALARIELRGYRRHRWRSLLALLLVAVPVAAVTAAGALHRTSQPTPEERRTAVLGRAALRVSGVAEDELGRVRALLPPGSRVEALRAGVERLSVSGVRLAARRFELDPSGLAAGLVHVSRGRAPLRPGEVALSPMLLRGLGRAPGEEVALESRPGESVAITGVVLDPEDLDAPLVLGPRPGPGGGPRELLIRFAPEAGSADPAESPRAVAATAARLRAAGWPVVARAELGAPDPFESLAIFVIGGFGFVEAALVIAAGFAVSVRRRRREIGLVGASGARPGQIGAALVASAAALALLGALVGVALGLGAAAALQPLLDGWNRRANGPLELSLAHALGAVGLGLLAAVVAVALPARSAARLPIRVALGGRRPAQGRAGHWLALGVALVCVGAGAMFLGAGGEGPVAAVAILAGSVLGTLGLALWSPWLLVALARCAAPLPPAWRLAARDTGRHRARNAPVVAAILAGTALSVTLTALTASIESALAARPAFLRDDQVLVDGPAAEGVARRLALELGALAAAPLAAVCFEGRLVRAVAENSPASAPAANGDDWIVCGGEELVHSLGAGAGLEAFRAGRLLARAAETGARVALRADGRTLASLEPVAVPPAQRVRAPVWVLATERARALGLEPGPPPGRELAPWCVRLAEPVSYESLARARALAAASAGASVDCALLHRRPERTIERAALALTFLTGLLVIAIATALSAAESGADVRVLRAVGAAPRVLRGHLAARAGYLALVGCALAVPAGMFPVFGLFATANFTLELALPWPELATLVFGLPALAYAATWLAAVLLPPAEGRHP